MPASNLTVHPEKCWRKQTLLGVHVANINISISKHLDVEPQSALSELITTNALAALDLLALETYKSVEVGWLWVLKMS